VDGDMRAIGLALQPTFLAFTPWTTLDSYRDLLRTLAALDLVEQVAPVQLALRLLITHSSRLLELEDVRRVIGNDAAAFDSAALIYPWKHPDSALDALAAHVFRLVSELQAQKRSRAEIFSAVWAASGAGPLPRLVSGPPAAYVDEPWYCCAEPVPV
jgi:hypothetical protein